MPNFAARLPGEMRGSGQDHTACHREITYWKNEYLKLQKVMTEIYSTAKSQIRNLMELSGYSESILEKCSVGKNYDPNQQRPFNQIHTRPNTGSSHLSIRLEPLNFTELNNIANENGMVYCGLSPILEETEDEADSIHISKAVGSSTPKLREPYVKLTRLLNTMPSTETNTPPRLDKLEVMQRLGLIPTPVQEGSPSPSPHTSPVTRRRYKRRSTIAVKDYRSSQSLNTSEKHHQNTKSGDSFSKNRNEETTSSSSTTSSTDSDSFTVAQYKEKPRNSDLGVKSPSSGVNFKRRKGDDKPNRENQAVTTRRPYSRILPPRRKGYDESTDDSDDENWIPRENSAPCGIHTEFVNLRRTVKRRNTSTNIDDIYDHSTPNKENETIHNENSNAISRQTQSDTRLNKDRSPKKSINNNAISDEESGEDKAKRKSVAAKNRPMRNGKPKSLKEPSLRRKLRR